MTKSRELSDYANKQTTKNIIINGNFDIWQRGTSLIAGTGTRYLSDRWGNESVGTTIIPTRESIILGDIQNAKYFHRSVVTSVVGTGNYASLLTGIEDVSTHAGNTITLSFYAKADVPKNIASDLRQEFGTGGTPSTTVTGIGVTTHALTTNWQKFTTTINIPSIAGKMIGTNNDNFLQLVFWFESGSDNDARTNALGQQSGIFDIAQVQIESGGIASDFDLRSFGIELSLCQRYYEKSYDENIAIGSVVTDGFPYLSSQPNTALVQFQSPVYATPKRIFPTRTVYSTITPNTPNTVTENDSGGSNRTALGITQGNTKLFGTVIHSALNGGAFRYIYHWTADAEF